jgi:hypothetical protein
MPWASPTLSSTKFCRISPVSLELRCLFELEVGYCFTQGYIPSYLRTLFPLHLANSEDRGLLELNQQVANVTFPAPTPLVPYPEAEHIGIGRDFYALSQNLPDGTTL